MVQVSHFMKKIKNNTQTILRRRGCDLQSASGHKQRECIILTDKKTQNAGCGVVSSCHFASFFTCLSNNKLFFPSYFFSIQKQNLNIQLWLERIRNITSSIRHQTIWHVRSLWFAVAERIRGTCPENSILELPHVKAPSSIAGDSHDYHGQTWEH